MAVFPDIIDLTDEDDVMHVYGQETEKIITSPSWTNAVLNSNE